MNRNSLGRIVPAFLFLVALVAITGSLFAGGAAEVTSEDGPVTIEYWHWSPNENDVVDAIIADFEAEHPDIRVNVTSMVPSDYWTRIRLQASQGALPDVMEMSSGFLESWATDGFLYDLAPYVSGSAEADEFYPSLLESARSIAGTDGYFALPYAFVMPVMYFNKDMFDAAGVSYPDSDWTWDDFLAAAEALTIDTDGDGEIDQWGHHFYGRYAQIEPWVYANDGALIDRDAMRFDPDDNAMEALDFLMSLVLEHEVVPPPKTVAELDTEEVFAQGISAMWIDGSWNIGYIRDNVGDRYNWGIAPVPTGTGGPISSRCPGTRRIRMRRGSCCRISPVKDGRWPTLTPARFLPTGPSRRTPHFWRKACDRRRRGFSSILPSEAR